MAAAAEAEAAAAAAAAGLGLGLAMAAPPATPGSMFGCIAAGRLVDLAPQQTDVNKFVFALPEPESINHIVLFMCGTVPFEPGFAAAIYLGTRLTVAPEPLCLAPSPRQTPVL